MSDWDDYDSDNSEGAEPLGRGCRTSCIMTVLLILVVFSLGLLKACRSTATGTACTMPETRTEATDVHS